MLLHGWPHEVKGGTNTLPERQPCAQTETETQLRLCYYKGFIYTIYRVDTGLVILYVS